MAPRQFKPVKSTKLMYATIHYNSVLIEKAGSYSWIVLVGYLQIPTWFVAEQARSGQHGTQVYGPRHTAGTIDLVPVRTLCAKRRKSSVRTDCETQNEDAVKAAYLIELVWRRRLVIINYNGSIRYVASVERKQLFKGWIFYFICLSVSFFIVIGYKPFSDTKMSGST